MKLNFYALFLIIGLFNCSDRSDQSLQSKINFFTQQNGAIVTADTTSKTLSLVFTADKYADGSDHILSVLDKFNLKGAFFLTGDFYRNGQFSAFIKKAITDGHYLGAHSDKHLLYCAWENRDSLLVSKEDFKSDLLANYNEMRKFNVKIDDSPYFLPPYEWYNDSISLWTKQMDLQLINHSTGTRSHADYTTPEMANYISSIDIFKSIKSFEKGNSAGLNGFMMLIHLGTDPDRTDKFYFYLEDLIKYVHQLGYEIIPLKKLLKN